MPRTRPDQEVDEAPVERPEPPQPSPPGADDAGAEKPHKTCSDGTTAGASGVKTRVG
jgi:hypothetical protein